MERNRRLSKLGVGAHSPDSGASAFGPAGIGAGAAKEARLVIPDERAPGVLLPHSAPLGREHTLYELRERNLARLAEILANPIAAMVYDVDGTVRLHGVTDEQILQRQAELLAAGTVGAASTARGESAYFAISEPLLPHLRDMGINPAKTPYFVSSRGGACTEQPYAGGRGEIIDSHPLDAALYEAVTTHPLVRAMEEATPGSYRQGLEDLYEKVYRTWGVSPDPRSRMHPGILHDTHRVNGNSYKLTLFHNAKNPPIALPRPIIERYFPDGMPPSMPAMAEAVKHILQKDGIPVSTSASVTDPEIDVTAPEVDKGTAYHVIRNITADHYGMKPEEVDQHAITVGDSPDKGYNDEALLAQGVGVTNVNYFTAESKPCVLDIPGDKVQRTRELFANVTPLPRPSTST